MTEKEGKDLSIVAYILGMISIVLAFFQPLAGIILGIMGLSFGKKYKTELSRKGIKYSKIGILIGVIVLLISLAITYYVTRGQLGIGNFPA